jgi:hypothetical protein
MLYVLYQFVTYLLTLPRKYCVLGISDISRRRTGAGTGTGTGTEISASS